MKNIKNILRQEISEITQIFQKIENQEIDKNFIKLCEESIEAIKKRKKLFFLGTEVVQLMLSTWLLN